MKYWWSAVVRDYFTFTKRERTGLLIFLFIAICLIFVVPRFFNPPKQTLNKQALLSELAQLKITIDSSSDRNRYYAKEDEDFEPYRPKRSYDLDVKGVLFEFDPNTLNVEGWQKLGVKDKTIQTIQKFLAKGYQFRKPENIGKIYGIKPAQAQKLMPYVRIAAKETPAKSTFVDNVPAPNRFPSKKSSIIIFDINKADTADLIMLSGIGNKLAARIVNFRNKLGGFVSVNQMGETFGLPDSTFQKIKPQLKCEDPLPNTININTADAAGLKSHPYMSWNMANAIVKYREQHGHYNNVDDLNKIEIISKELISKLTPYLTVK